MTREEHYTDGRRWSHISNAWILLSSWNDREELATMTAAAESIRQENVKLRAEIARLDQLTTMQDGGIRSLHDQIAQKDAEIERLREALEYYAQTVISARAIAALEYEQKEKEHP